MLRYARLLGWRPENRVAAFRHRQIFTTPSPLNVTLETSKMAWIFMNITYPRLPQYFRTKTGKKEAPLTNRDSCIGRVRKQSLSQCEKRR